MATVHSDYIYRVMPEIEPGVFQSRPIGGSPGFVYRLNKWTPRVTDTRLCERGYHTLNAAGLLVYVEDGDAIVRCERRGCGGSDGAKQTNESIMPVEIVGYATATALRLTAADSAESVLPLYHNLYPDDMTLEVVIHTVRAFALGGATAKELSAVGAAAREARVAADAASRVADAADAAIYAAYAADAAAARVANAAAYYAADAASRVADAATCAAGQSLLYHAKFQEYTVTRDGATTDRKVRDDGDGSHR